MKAGIYNNVQIDASGKIIGTGNKVYPKEIATGTEINTGTDNEKYVTAQSIADSDIAFLSDLVSVTAEDEISAFAGGGQGGATLLDSTYNLITIVATSGDSCKLIPAISGDVKYVTNLSANDMDLFPALGEKFIQNITDLGANIQTVISAGMSVQFICYQTGIWRFI